MQLFSGFNFWASSRPLSKVCVQRGGAAATGEGSIGSTEEVAWYVAERKKCVMEADVAL